MVVETGVVLYIGLQHVFRPAQQSLWCPRCHIWMIHWQPLLIPIKSSREWRALRQRTPFLYSVKNNPLHVRFITQFTIRSSSVPYSQDFLTIPGIERLWKDWTVVVRFIPMREICTARSVCICRCVEPSAEEEEIAARNGATAVCWQWKRFPGNQGNLNCIRVW